MIHKCSKKRDSNKIIILEFRKNMDTKDLEKGRGGLEEIADTLMGTFYEFIKFDLIFFEHSGQSPVNSRLCPMISKTVDS